jgi:hypothetical protein
MNVKLSPAIAEMVVLCYQSMNAAREYARGISSDPTVGSYLQTDFFHIASQLGTPINRLERRIPKDYWKEFKEQVKENDPIRLDNIKAMYVRMLPEQQEMAELLMQGILRGEVTIDSNTSVYEESH